MSAAQNHQQVDNSKARTDGPNACFFSRCDRKTDSKLLILFQLLRHIYILVRFRRFYSHGILTKEHTRFTLSRKPTWISFTRRCCENLSQLFHSEDWNLLAAGHSVQLKRMHISSRQNSNWCFISNLISTLLIHFTAKPCICGSRQSGFTPEHGRTTSPSQFHPGTSYYWLFYGGSSDAYSYIFVRVDLRDYWQLRYYIPTHERGAIDGFSRCFPLFPT